MKTSGWNLVIGIIIAFITLMGSIFLLSFTHDQRVKEVTEENCEQYKVVPEKYIDRIPTSCTVIYFAHQEKLNKEKEQRKAEAKQRQIDAVVGKPE